jgi:hypothetical protein
MLGSRKQPHLMEGRRIVWTAEDADGTAVAPFRDALTKLLEGGTEDLLIGYWDYGNSIVVTAPDEKTDGQ